MFNATIKSSLRLSHWIALAMGLVLIGASVPAFATSTPGTPAVGKVNIIEWISPTGVGGNTLLIQTNQNGTLVNYFAQIATQAGCTENNQNIDTIKIWQSQAQAALLAGKNLKVYFNICNSQNYITTMDLNQ